MEGPEQKRSKMEARKQADCTQKVWPKQGHFAFNDGPIAPDDDALVANLEERGHCGLGLLCQALCVKRSLFTRASAIAVVQPFAETSAPFGKAPFCLQLFSHANTVCFFCETSTVVYRPGVGLKPCLYCCLRSSLLGCAPACRCEGCAAQRPRFKLHGNRLRL